MWSPANPRWASMPRLRLIGVPHTFRGTFWVRKDLPMKTIADLKGKKVPLGYSAMLTIDKLSRALLATGGLTEKDVTPVLVPNVVRGADDFATGSQPTSSPSPLARRSCAKSTPPSAASARWKFRPAAWRRRSKIFPDGYLVKAAPNPFFIGVDHPMDVYAWDNLLITNDKVPDDVIDKIIDTLVNNAGRPGGGAAGAARLLGAGNSMSTTICRTIRAR